MGQSFGELKYEPFLMRTLSIFSFRASVFFTSLGTVIFWDWGEGRTSREHWVCGPRAAPMVMEKNTEIEVRAPHLLPLLGHIQLEQEDSEAAQVTSDWWHHS